MHIVIFDKGLKSPRKMSLLSISLSLIICLLLVSSLGLVIGSWYSSINSSNTLLDTFKDLTVSLEDQRNKIRLARQENEDTLDALSIHIAQINARIIRLDALGRRLTEISNIDDSEFDFDLNPPVGGPEKLVTSGVNNLDFEIINRINFLDEQLNRQETQLDILEGYLANQILNNRVIPQGRPVKSGWISSYFGKRNDPFTGKVANHTGVDFAGKSGVEIIAVADGVVTWSSDRYGYGIMIELDHGNGYLTRYAHNLKNLVSVGDIVKKGQIIALMGETGRATGPNLHFEVLHNGNQINPLNYISR
tara:strand:- start:6884 stop:7801 length:918 start_codon:yes stop_codon:yes gene_type:complete